MEVDANPHDTFDDPVEQRLLHLKRILDVVLRVPILFILDLICNGTIFTLLLTSFQQPLLQNALLHPRALPNPTVQLLHNVHFDALTPAQQFIVKVTDSRPDGLMAASRVPDIEPLTETIDVMFSPNRQRVTVWHLLTWPVYLCSMVVYFGSIATCTVLLLSGEEYLQMFYAWMAPVVMLAVCLYVNSGMVEHDQADKLNVWRFLFDDLTISGLKHYFMHVTVNIVCMLMCLFLYARSRKYRNLKPCPTWFLAVCFTGTVLGSMIGLPDRILSWLPATFFLPLFVLESLQLLKRVPAMVRVGLESYASLRDLGRALGVEVVSHYWQRLQLGHVLRVFWLTRCMFHLVFIVFETTVAYHQNNGTSLILFDRSPSAVGVTMVEAEENGQNGLNMAFTAFFAHLYQLFPDPMKSFVKEYFINTFRDFRTQFDYLLARSCETTIAVFATASIVSGIGHTIVEAFYMWLQDEDEEHRHAGSLTGVLFLILTVQGGLPGLNVHKRLTKLYRNSWLLLTASLHFIHHMNRGVLTRLCTAGNYDITRHIRAWITSLILIAVPAGLIFYVWSSQPKLLNPWVLSITIFAFEVVLKTLVSVVVYLLLMFGMKRGNAGTWQRLDDQVYYVKAFGATIEFIFGILLLFNGVWILFYDHGGVISIDIHRAMMICIHGYFNVYLQGIEGFRTFNRRRFASKRVASLAVATSEQLRMHNDVCSICYDEMSEVVARHPGDVTDDVVKDVRVTHCGHFFHSNCLRKWLYEQDMCPMCHQKVFADEAPPPDAPELQAF